ncbi:MAG: transposase [Chloroflexi bacterium]|nr:transposase [Chloroflexota bacterium]
MRDHHTSAQWWRHQAYRPMAQVQKSSPEGWAVAVVLLHRRASRGRGGGVIAENDPGEQRKVIKYNRLLANCLSFHTVCTMTRALHKLRADGAPIQPETVAALSPYIRTAGASGPRIFEPQPLVARALSRPDNASRSALVERFVEDPPQALQRPILHDEDCILSLV